MIVMKFGGTSIADAASVERVVEIVRKYMARQPVVVISAMGKTTRNLLAAAKLFASGNLREAKKKLGEIHQYHLDLIHRLFLDSWRMSAEKRIDGYFQELHRLLDGLSVLRELTPRSQDKVLSYGELISTAIVSTALNAKNITSTLMDARKLVITDEQFTSARPIQELTYRKIRQAIQPKIKSDFIPVVQGYIGSTMKGATTTLGFEGSDLTACLVAAALKASDVQIWKDVSGIMTADPEIVPDARTVKTISFEEVEELTYFGARVFYTRAVEPARQANIPVHIYNSKSSDKTGTEVTLIPKPCKNLVKSISCKCDLTLIYIRSYSDVLKTDFLASIIKLLEQSNVDPKIIHISKNNISLVIESSEYLDSFVTKLDRLGDVVLRNGKATISLVGENLRDRHDIADMILHVLKDQPVDLISNGVSPVNFTLVLDEKDVEKSLCKLHQYFFKTLDPAVFE